MENYEVTLTIAYCAASDAQSNMQCAAAVSNFTNKKCSLLFFSPFFCYDNYSPRSLYACNFSRFFSISPSAMQQQASTLDSRPAGATVTLQEWQSWGTASPVPSIVSEVIEDLKVMVQETDSEMNFGGNHGKLQGDFKVKEDKKHRAKYQALADSEKKLQFFSGRQIACRILGSRGYLCEKCWLPLEDCLCSKVKTCSLWHGMRFWLYMHPKDFLRQNNTGKLLWQVFGIHAATLCLYGISEHEETMWNEIKHAGRNNVWCLYPDKNASTMSVNTIITQGPSTIPDCPPYMTDKGQTVNFILVDGTWSNSGAMFKRLKERASVLWGEDLPCISLNAGASAMHKLRPQPSLDRTCTAAAAIGLLCEMQLIPEFHARGLDKQAEALRNALEALLEALTARRIRMGRSIARKERHNRNFC